MKNINPLKIYIVVSGDPGPGNECIRFVTFDYKKALEIVKKIVISENKKTVKKNKNKSNPFRQLIKKDRRTEKGVWHGEIIDSWGGRNTRKYFHIVLFQMDKEYTTDWEKY